jgi:hypothetical protein
MPQLLQIIQRGDRENPTITKFGASELLMIHADGNADICDATTHAVIRPLGWDGVKNMGYSPAKLMNGERVNQLLDMPAEPKLDMMASVRAAIGGFAFTAVLGAALIFAGNVTGCTAAVGKQFDKDMATSTVYPRLNNEELLSQEDERLKEFRRQTMHANKVLASARRNGPVGGAL